MLNYTPATAKPSSPAAKADAARAAMRPPVGLGAGAFLSEGTQVGSGASERIASVALPRVRGGFAAATSQARAQAHGRGCGAFQVGASQVDTVGCGAYQPGTIGSSTVGTSTISLMARINPVTPGGLGPHPVREPVPV